MIADRPAVNRVAIWSAGVVLLVGFLGAWIGTLPFAGDDTRCPMTGYPEGTAIEYELSVAPPGATECRVTLPNGERADRTHFPWRSWISLIPFALAAGLAVTSLAGGWLRAVGLMSAAAVLAVLGVAVLFGVV